MPVSARLSSERQPMQVRGEPLNGRAGFDRTFAACPSEPENPTISWSGREDSNLRPLPPEDADPVFIRRFSVVFRAFPLLSSGLESRFVRGRGSKPNLGALFSRIARGAIARASARLYRVRFGL
jgi:hypothetical protein